MSKNIISGAVLALGLALTPAVALAGPKHCPPGLAKKSPACVPPGQAKKSAGRDYDRDRTYVDRDGYVRIREHDGFRRGDYYVDRRGYVRVRDYDRYRLPRPREGEAYYRDGTVVFRVDRETRQIIELVRLVDLVFGN